MSGLVNPRDVVEAIEAERQYRRDLEAERGDLYAIGDRMQSNLSRILEWCRTPDDHAMPYEVAMACVEARSDIDAWTEIRSQPST
jgi:hypothetical protein